MIKNIHRLKEFGIFQNYVNTDTRDFGKYNLFYGWNGSGKSTLSSLFRCIETRSPSEKFQSAVFTINHENGDPITQANIENSSLNICTFNHDFIKENISWNSVVKSILLIDKEKITERQKLEVLKEQQQTDTKAYGKEAKKITELENAISKFLTDSARLIKASLQSIDTTDKYYLNYDKRKFVAFIDSNHEAVKSEDSLLNEQEIVELTNAAKPDQKSEITFNQQTRNSAFATAKAHLDDLLKTSVVNQTVKRLVENRDIKAWVKTGLDLHKDYDINQCEFCGNDITEDRLKQLEAHFNDDYKAFQDRLEKVNHWLSEQYLQAPQLPPTSNFYEEFKTEYDEACSSLNKAITAINKEITAWHIVLKKKIENQLETTLVIEPITEKSIDTYNDKIIAIESAITKHNHKAGNFQEETKRAKQKLELHYATTELKSFDYLVMKKEVVDRTGDNARLKSTIDDRSRKIRELENLLSDEGLGATQFNKSLHRFLGRDELSLRFNPHKKGYEILRNEIDPVNINLSEGEKTAIAFVYFITKLKENDNKIEETIVVVDDPISSFDSNHLFHAFSFMKMNCEKAKQLFVFTHNFTFFKLVRDWISRANSNKHNQDIANFYVVKANNNRPRSSTVENAERALRLHNSEYHYIFSRLYSLKNQQDLKTDDYFLAANLSRKLLEAFFSFKFPLKRGHFTNLFNVAILASKNPEDEGKEKIRKFINEYSHYDLIETNENFIENLIGESPSVISDIFCWIEELDTRHYQEMIKEVS